MSTNALRPKLVLPRAGAALAWYVDVLDAEITQRFDHDGRVVFAAMTVVDTTVTLKDADEYDAVPEPGPILDVTLNDPDATERRLLDAGAESLIAVADQPYGARAGRVRDPFGVQWLLQTPLTLEPEQVQEAVDRMHG